MTLNPDPIAYDFDRFRFDILRRAVFSVHDRDRIDLTNHEYKLLLMLCESGGKVLQRQSIAAVVNGRIVRYDDRIVDVGICRLRKKIDGKLLIKSIRNIGYVLATSVTAIYQ